MKKTLFLFTILLAPLSVFAANANKMTMVTYFPVKYVAYSQVDVMKQMDVGLTSACQMNLGCTSEEGFNTGKSLRVNNLLNIAGGKLDLNDAPAIEGNTARIGSGNGVSDFDFETNLRVGNYKQGYTMQTDNMYLSELNLFGYKFPACSGETMSWQKLKLKNKEEVYLVCGEAEQGACTPTNNGKTTYTASCPSGQSGQITYTWNSTSCKYDETSNTCRTVQTCSDATYKASHKSECCPSAPKTDTVCWVVSSWTLKRFADYDDSVLPSCASFTCNVEGDGCIREHCVHHHHCSAGAGCESDTDCYDWGFKCVGTYTKNGW
ncbi:hypothetical protein [Candidatus Avelusimicrobium fimicolum]|uniref:hypothetical protein n=1 Tax=Candidatus Avelusimicrobium fimicolum TaxID=3416216 RepID=UPI003D0EFD4C